MLFFRWFFYWWRRLFFVWKFKTVSSLVNYFRKTLGDYRWDRFVQSYAFNALCRLKNIRIVSYKMRNELSYVEKNVWGNVTEELSVSEQTSSVKQIIIILVFYNVFLWAEGKVGALDLGFKDDAMYTKYYLHIKSYHKVF